MATEKLRSCIDQDDIESTFEKLPVGMESFYDRMASSIADDTSHGHRTIATAILQCVTCSLRSMKIPELAQALNDHLAGDLDLSTIILKLCHGFVVVDNDGNVSMVHKTAREYLLGEVERPFHIGLEPAHKQLFLGCMRCLRSVGLRAKLAGPQRPALLDYAANSWAVHLASTPPGDIEVTEELFTFLKGRKVLTWIQALAETGQLRGLVQASKFLSKYAAKQDKYYRDRQIQDHNVMEKQELIQNWAIDLVKIVGKFGKALRQRPESIHNHIPAFCPQDCLIYNLFGKSEGREFVISGLSNKNWDDSLARIPLTSGYFASTVSAAGSRVAILASSEFSGAVFVYDASDFEEIAASPMIHGERVYRTALNNTGTMIVSYGYHTTKIWDVNSGDCMFCVDNIEAKPTPLTMLLTKNDTELLVGMDDRCLRSLDLTQSQPTWRLVAEVEEEKELEGHFLNAASNMALNSNGTLLTVAYRGYPLSAWEVDGPQQIGYCPRAREESTRGEVMEALWHPHHEEVLGLYLSGVVFKWRPYENKVEEIATGSCHLAISKDGNLFITGDVRGLVKVYNRSTFTVVYQLVSEDSVLGLCFSPDSSRFYDIRGFYGNAWEPETLVKLSEQRVEDESDNRSHGSGSAGSAKSTPISSFPRIDSVTVIATSPLGQRYCVGTENGVVRLHDTQRGKLIDLYKSRSFFSIEKMAWCDDGELFCFSESSKMARIMTITNTKGDPSPVVKIRAEISLKNRATGPIQQLLFHPDSRHLLVYSDHRLDVISLSESSVTHSLHLDAQQCVWVIHPKNPSCLIGCTPNAFHVLTWDLTIRQTYGFEYTPYQKVPSEDWRNGGRQRIDRALITPDKRHLLVQLSLSKEKEKTLLYFDLSQLETTTDSATETVIEDAGISPRTIDPITLSRDVSSQVAFPLAILSQDRLVFLSKAFSVCSCPLPSAPTCKSAGRQKRAPRAHSTGSMPSKVSITTIAEEGEDPDSVAEIIVNHIFSIPGDWLSRGRMALCSIWANERSFLCPRNGEVALVRSSTLT